MPAIRGYPNICRDACFVTGTAQKSIVIQLQQIYEDGEIVQTFPQLGATDKPSETLIAGLEAYICKLHVSHSHTELTHVADMRWWLSKSRLKMRVYFQLGFASCNFENTLPDYDLVL